VRVPEHWSEKRGGGLYPLAYPRGRFGLGRPSFVERLYNEFRIDNVAHWMMNAA